MSTSSNVSGLPSQATSSFGSGHFGAPALDTHPTRKQPSRAASLKPPGFYSRPVDYGLDDEWHPHDEGPNTYKAGKGSKPSSSSTDPPEAKGSVREGCTTSAGNVPRLQEEWYRWAAEQLKSYKRSPAQKDLTGSFLVGDTRYYPATSAYAPESAPYGSRGPGATDCSCYARTMSLTAPAPISHPPIPSIHITRPDE